MINGKIFEVCTMRSGKRLRCPLSPLLLKIVLEILEQVVKYCKGRNDWQSLFVENMIIGVENTKESPDKQ